MEKDYGEMWDTYSIEFCKKLEYDCDGDWSRLDPDEQEIAALWKLVADMYNGGFLQFFCNWGYECYWYAMRGIQRIGDVKHSRACADKLLAAGWKPQYSLEEGLKTTLEYFRSVTK